MNIYVGNLPYTVSDGDLRKAFSDYGEVSSVNIISNKLTGRSKGFGFVEMPNNSEADAAMKALNGAELMGRTITVNEARPKGDAPPRNRY